MASSIASSIDAWAANFARQINSAAVLERALPDIRQTIQTSIEENFRASGRYGNANPWGGGTQSWAPIRRKGKILLDSVHLYHSISVDVRIESGGIVIELRAGQEYAAIHQYGGRAGVNRSVTIVPRPFLVIQDEDIRMIVEILTEEMARGM